MPEKTHSAAVRRPDWRNAEDYRHMLDYDATSWAGVWLSRNPEFLADLDSVLCRSFMDHGVFVVTCAEDSALSRWGVRCCLLAENGRPLFFWLPQHNQHVLEVEAVAAADGFDLRRCPLLKAVLRGGETTHLLFSDGARTLQVDVQGMFDLDRPVCFRSTIQGWDEFAARPGSLLRLGHLYRKGYLVKSLFPKEQRAQRWIDMLRAWDACQAGARQREIADVLFGGWAPHEGWDAGCRVRVQRLVKSAKRMVVGGHLTLLWRTEGRKIGLRR